MKVGDFMAYALLTLEEKMMNEEDFNHYYRKTYNNRKLIINEYDIYHRDAIIIGIEEDNYFKEYISEISRIRSSNIRIAEHKNNILGLGIKLHYSHQDSVQFSIYEWIEKSIQWLQDEFNPVNHIITGKDFYGRSNTIVSDNVKAVVYHKGNKSESPHLHCFIIPISGNAKLCATKHINFFDDNNILTDYANAMKDLGLERAPKYEKVSAEEVKRFKSEVSEYIYEILPYVEMDETLEDYKMRADKAYQRLMIHQDADKLKLEQDLKCAKSKVGQFKKRYNKITTALSWHYKTICKVFGKEEMDVQDIRYIRRYCDLYDDFFAALKSYPDQEEARYILECYYKVIENKRK